MLTQGVERIIDQVVNPKIFQVIKPKIDEIVCSQLRLDYREWQAETTRRKAEALRIHQLQQQQKIQAVVNSIQQKQQQQQAANSASATAMSSKESFSAYLVMSFAHFVKYDAIQIINNNDNDQSVVVLICFIYGILL